VINRELMDNNAEKGKKLGEVFERVEERLKSTMQEVIMTF